MLFRREKIKRWFPKIVRFVERIDPDLMKDQIEPCGVSHPGEDCSTHAAALVSRGVAKNAYGCCCRKINCVCTTHFDSL